MKTIKISEATPDQLNWLVAVCEGGTDFCSNGIAWGFTFNGKLRVLAKGWAPSMSFLPSSDWKDGGPIIERERITTYFDYEDVTTESGKEITLEVGWKAHITQRHYWQTPRGKASGPTPLIAAMRCYCVSKLGETAEVPEEL